MRWDRFLTVAPSKCPEGCSGRGFCLKWWDAKEDGRPWCMCHRGFEVCRRSTAQHSMAQRVTAQHSTAWLSRLGRQTYLRFTARPWLHDVRWRLGLGEETGRQEGSWVDQRAVAPMCQRNNCGPVVMLQGGACEIEDDKWCLLNCGGRFAKGLVTTRWRVDGGGRSVCGGEGWVPAKGRASC